MNRQMIIDYLQEKYTTNGLSVGGKHVPFVEDVTCGCQGCGNSFEGKDVMIVDGVGPMCFRCLHNLVEITLG